MTRNRHPSTAVRLLEPFSAPFWTVLIGLLLSAPPIHSSPADSSPELLRDLAQRRRAVMEEMDRQGVLILFSGEERPYSGDVNYEFRQENNFHYLTAIPQPGAILVLMPRSHRTRELLFIPKRNPEKELWSGTMLSREEASRISGISAVRDTAGFEPFIESFLNGAPDPDDAGSTGLVEGLEGGTASIYLLPDPGPANSGSRSGFEERLRKGSEAGIDVKDASSIFRSLRAIKSSFEIQQIQTAVDITVEAHLEVMRTLRPGLREFEVGALMEYLFRRRGSSGWAFPSIIAGGSNTTTLHHRPGERQILDGELLLMDTGAEYNHYAADITRTIPAGGRFTPEQAAIYRLVFDAQTAVMSIVKPGASLRSLNLKALEVLGEGLKRLGLTTDGGGTQTRVYCPHGVSHFLGMDVHDVSAGEILKPNMVLTVEPGIYIRPDSLDRLSGHGISKEEIDRIRPSFERFVNIGIRIEDDLLVTEDGFTLLSGKAPRRLSEIEALVSGSMRP